MWYYGYTGVVNCCYATSPDGLHWTKPHLNLREYKGSKENNIWAFNTPCNLYRNENETDPEKRYVSWGLQVRRGDDGHDGDYGLYQFCSPDGLRWTRQTPQPLLPGRPQKYLGAIGGDGANVYWLESFKKYICFFNLSCHPNPNPAPNDQPKNRDYMRAIARFESIDGTNWNTDSPSWAFIRDEKDNAWDPYIQFYGNTPLVNPVGDLLLGITWLFHSNEATMELGFSCSTDSVTWHRPFRGKYVLSLSDAGQWDCAMMNAANNLIEKDGLWWLYYNGCPYLHRTAEEFPGEGKRYGAIGLAQKPVGRIVSAQSWRTEGSWTVGPLQLTGTHLYLNAAILDHLKVSLLDEKDNPLNGFTSPPMQGNALELPVTWNGAPDLSALQNQPVKIRFDLNDAEIFGFVCR